MGDVWPRHRSSHYRRDPRGLMSMRPHMCGPSVPIPRHVEVFRGRRFEFTKVRPGPNYSFHEAKRHPLDPMFSRLHVHLQPRRTPVTTHYGNERGARRVCVVGTVRGRGLLPPLPFPRRPDRVWPWIVMRRGAWQPAETPNHSPAVCVLGGDAGARERRVIYPGAPPSRRPPPTHASLRLSAPIA